MFKCVMGAELTGVAYVEDVLRGLETGIEAAQQATKANHKVAKVRHKYLSENTCYNPVQIHKHQLS